MLWTSGEFGRLLIFVAVRYREQVLLPIHNFKKFSSLVGHTTALAVPFVRDLLPDMEGMYQSEMSEQRMRAAAAQVSAESPSKAVVSEAPVTAEEATLLTKEFETAKENCYLRMSEEFVSQNVVFLDWNQDIAA